MSPGAFLASFAATGVEVLETAVIVYAIVRGGYRREALAGIVLAFIVWLALAWLGISLVAQLPLLLLRIAAALAVLVLGLIWIWGSWPGRVDTELIEDTEATAAVPVVAGRFAAVLFCFKFAFLEGGEVVLVVAPVGLATQAWTEVTIGVVTALLVVTGLMALLHGQLQRLPERRLKLGAGVLCALLGAAMLLEVALAARG